MDKTIKLINQIIEYLNRHTRYAVLRNFEGLPSSNDSRDIDIIIGRKDLSQHRSSIIKLINESGWKIVNYLDNGRLTTIVCGIVHEDQIELIQWDFFVNTSVHGITLMKAEELLEDCIYNGYLYHVSKPSEFLDKYTYNRAVGAPYPQKYQAVRSAIGNNEKVRSKLKNLFGSEDSTIIDRMPKRQLLLNALKQNCRSNLFSTIRNLFLSQWIYLSSFISSKVAVSLGFTGPDGAGKTTVIELLKENIYSVFGKATDYHHFRPTLIPNLGEAAHAGGLKKEVDKEYENPHRSKKKGLLSSFARLCYYTIDYFLGFWIKIKPGCRLTKFIIFDRYYTDIIADSRRSSIHLDKKFLYYWGKLMVPSLKYNILLTADTDVILSRKQELDADGINQINKKLNYLSDKKGYHLIINEAEPIKAVLQILALIFEKQHDKNIKRLGYK